jgi:cytochrome c-type biogenesis protein CcmF
LIPELGHFALILALAVALVQGTLPLIGASRGDLRLMALGRTAALTQAFLVLLAFGALTQAYVTSDFSVLNVVDNSHSAKPLLYKISGVWGNHEGSILLWALILALFGAAVAIFGNNLPDTLRSRVLAIQALIGVGFLAFLLFTSNPFARVFPAPPDGNGLNPLLQDPGLAFHPPLLYLGYVGYSGTYAFAVAALLEICDPGFRHDLPRASCAALHQQLPDAREVSRCHTHSAGRTRRTQSVDGDVGTALGPERLP